MSTPGDEPTPTPRPTPQHWEPDPGTQPTVALPAAALGAAATPPPSYPPQTPALAAQSTPASGMPTSPADGASDGPERRRANRWLLAGLIVSVVLLLAMAALATYLWFVNERWTEQNEALRDTATELGASLGEEQRLAAEQSEQIAALQVELEDVTARISDLANEEAQANDSQDFLEGLADAFVQCIDEHDTLLTQALRNGYSYSNSNARNVQDDLDEYCDELIGAWEDYQAGRG